jgi:hypothetical protein
MRTPTAAPTLTLHDRLHQELPALTRTVWTSLRNRFPVLDEMEVTLGSPAERVVRPLAELLLIDGESGRGLSGVLEARCRQQARLLTRLDRPQQMLVDIYDYAMSLIVAQIWSLGDPGEYAELTEVTGRAGVALDTVQKAVVDTYWSQAHADRFGRQGRRALAHGLLTGFPTQQQARDAGVDVAERYRVAVLRSPDRTGAWRAAVSEQLHELLVLHAVLADEIVVFEPDSSPAGPSTVGNQPRLGQVAIGVAAAAPVAGLPRAVVEARRVAGLALTVPLLGRVVSTEQIPLELTLLQDGDLAASMCALAEPIAMRPDLLHTIRVLYQLDLNRTSTARRLGIARRTLSGRLTRIHELTGLDPTSTRGIQILYTALTAVSMRKAGEMVAGA